MHQIMTQPTGKGTLVCRSPFTYKELTITPGEESNGANIPRVFWMFQPPFHPDILTATFVHDILCQQEEYEKADEYFDELLEQSPIGSWKRKALVKAVRGWHTVAYKNNKPRRWLKLYREVF